MEVTTSPRASTPTPPRHLVPKFDPSRGFHQELRRRVDGYFADTGLKPRGDARMYLKTLSMFAWLAASWGLLMFWASEWWQVVPLMVSAGLAVAGIGFSVQHDGGHHAYSEKPWVNRLMASMLDFIGASSYFWNHKHNIQHHSFTNVHEHDDDISLGPLGRLSPHQPRLFFHRWQHVYLWPFYGFLTLKWHFMDDFRSLILGHNAGKPCARPRGWQLIQLFAGKAVFFGWTLVVPLMYHPWYLVLPVFLGASFVLGLTLSVVFQLAHAVGEANFPTADPEGGRMHNEWAKHQIETTVDFARGSRFWTWYAGGLNFQVVHHLFPRVCHVHYPALAEIVERTSREYGVRYTAYPSFRAGVAAHYRWLKHLGRAA